MALEASYVGMKRKRLSGHGKEERRPPYQRSAFCFPASPYWTNASAFTHH